MADVTLAREAQAILELFDKVAKINELLGHEIVDGDSAKATTKTLDALDDQRGRFNIFARNVGVFAEGHASLDWRLRESEDALDLTRQLLQSVQWFLRQAIEESLTFNTVWSGQAVSGPSVYDVEGSISTSGASFVTSEVSHALTDTAQDTDPAGVSTNPYGGVDATIDRLHRLSWLIRTPSQASQNAKARLHPIRDDEGNDVTSAFYDYATRVVRHRCPETTPELAEKLAKAVTTRRQRFLYRRKHQYKLAYPNVTRTKSTPTSCLINTGSVSPTLHTGSPLHRSQAKKPAVSTTSASAFSNSKFQREAVLGSQSVVSTALYSPEKLVESFQPPPPPKIKPGSKEFECPYCYIVRPVKEAQAPYWTQHFLKDLEPFVCLDLSCQQAELMFSDIGTWVSHMQYAHSTQWACSSPAHPRQVFAAKSDYESHVRNSHSGAVSDKHLHLLAKRAQVPGVAITSCPFCSYQPREKLKTGEHSHQLIGHVSNHLQLIALISLPEDGHDHEEEVSDSDKANESSEGAAPIVRDDLPSLQDHSDKLDSSSEGPARAARDNLSSRSSYSDVAEVQDKLADALDLDSLPTSSDAGDGDLTQPEWGFMETVFEYAGHDRDPVLQGFLRKLYLECSQNLKSTRGLKLPFASIPLSRNARFFGRSYALSKIEEALLSSTTASTTRLSELATNLKTFVIHGPGGMGKTQVAAEFVHRHRNDFDAILWAHADDTAKLSQDFSTIACQMGLVAEDSADARDFSHTRELVKRWLVDPRKDVNNIESDRASWLLVFDAVEDPSMLNAFWPYDGPGSILITSRNTFGWSNSLQLIPFSVDEASRYLLNVTERDEAKEDHSEIVMVSRKLGGLPLALTQMAGIMTKSDMSFAEFAHAYNERELRHQLLETAPSPELQAPQYEHSVASVFALENIRHGAALLNACSMLDPDGISEHIFTETFGKVHLPGLPASLSEYHHAKNELLKSSILTTEKGSGKLFVHRLVQDVARTRLSPCALRETFMACVQLITALWPFIDFTWRHGIARWSICEDLAPHVVRLCELAEHYQLFPSDVDDTGDFVFPLLLVDAGWYHHERGSFSDAESFNDMANQICSTWLAREDESHHADRGEWWTRKLNTILSELTHNRGSIAVETNQPHVALQYFQDFQRAMEEEFKRSPDMVKYDMRLAIAWNELGTAHMLNRRWDEGKKCFKHSIKTMKLLENFEPISISIPLVNLGLAYWLQGRPKEALANLEQGLEDRENAYGIDDRISFFRGRYLQALGNVVGTLGDQEKSLDYHRKALLHYKTTLGNAHHRTADMLVKIAEHSIRMGQHLNALALLDFARKAYDSRYEGDQSSAYTPEKARALYFRSRALHAMGKDTDADEAFEEAVELLVEADSSLAGCDPTALTAKDFDRLVAFWSK